MYLTFTDYQEMGGKLPKTDFESQEFAARKKIEAITYKRIIIKDDEANVSDDVLETLQRLVFALIERQLLGNVRGRRTIAESNDGRSVSYADDKGSAEALIRTYLEHETTVDGVLLISPSIQTARVLRV